jgi:hypothetical protein
VPPHLLGKDTGNGTASTAPIDGKIGLIDRIDNRVIKQFAHPNHARVRQIHVLIPVRKEMTCVIQPCLREAAEAVKLERLLIDRECNNL